MLATAAAFYLQSKPPKEMYKCFLYRPKSINRRAFKEQDNER